jgi:MutL protein
MSKSADVLTIEIGSTFTKLAFYWITHGTLQLGGRVSGLTTIGEQDVSIGYRYLLAEIEAAYGITCFEKKYLSSSAAGGLRIVVCGLTYNLTTKAALESALGAGGVVVKSIVGAINKRQAADIEKLNPNLILLCGGLDYGEEEVICQNAHVIADLKIDSVLIYAGNRVIQDEIKHVFATNQKKCVITDNIYPQVDQFHFQDVQTLIRQVFETEVVKAPGIECIQNETMPPIPTPLAVSYVTEVMGSLLGDLMVFDIGGATTDLHSYVAPKADCAVVQATLEPPLKRTVEGDIGVFYNLKNLLEPHENEALYITSPLDSRIDLPTYSRRACQKALDRHSGTKMRIHNGARLVDIIYGRDLTSVKSVIGTGGAIIYGFSDSPSFEQAFIDLPTEKLVPQKIEHCLIDQRYILSSIGLLAQEYPAEVSKFLAEEFAENI